MTFDFARNVGLLLGPDRLYFYELLAHNLTIAVRGIWSDPAATDAEKVDQMKCVNEILHRVTAKVWHLRSDGHWPDADIADLIDGWVAASPGIGDAVYAAIRRSFDTVSPAAGTIAPGPRPPGGSPAASR